MCLGIFVATNCVYLVSFGVLPIVHFVSILLVVLLYACIMYMPGVHNCAGYCLY